VCSSNHSPRHMREGYIFKSVDNKSSLSASSIHKHRSSPFWDGPLFVDDPIP
jgi:hypothetical protein